MREGERGQSSMREEKIDRIYESLKKENVYYNYYFHFLMWSFQDIKNKLMQGLNIKYRWMGLGQGIKR